ncbi:MAG: Ig-like domain-containing protein, partial [Planctomycetota bacterium]
MRRIVERGWVGIALVLVYILVFLPGTAQAAQERLPLDGIGADGCNWNGCAVAILDDDPDAAGADWATSTDNHTNHDGHFTFPTPSQALTAGADPQEFRVSLRQNATCGGATPSARIELWEAGGLVRAGTEFNVTAANNSQQVASFPWNATEITNAADVEIKVFGIRSGGAPASRCAVDLGAVEWNAEISAGNTAPTVTITAPPDASSFNQGDNVDFSGTASDTEDGDISANLSWTSNLDGGIGS